MDFSRFVKHGAHAVGMDLTAGGLRHTHRRLKALCSRQGYNLVQGDAENLAFQDNSFDLVYSWGVLHHTPDTDRAFGEAIRVLKPGGEIKAMVYHANSWTGWMLWARYGLLRLRPFTSVRRCVYERLESPGTKVYTPAEAKRLLKSNGFTDIQTSTKLGPGDLLEIRPSRRYQGRIYGAVWSLYPRWFIRLMGDRFGLYLLLTARKPATSSTQAAS